MTVEGLMHKATESKITYAEFDKVMKSKFGFESHIEKSDDEVKEQFLGHPRYFICYYDKEGKKVYGLFQREADAFVTNYDLFHCSRDMYMKGYTKKYEALLVAIEKQRLSKSIAA